MAIRILIADDHSLFRAGIKSLIVGHRNLVVTGEATTGQEAVKGVQLLHPDLVLMDIGMPGNEKLEATREIISQNPGIKVLIMTMHEDYELVQECLRIGVSGYIIKRAAESELIEAIYAIHKGMIYVHPSLIRSLVEPSLPKQNGNRNEYENLTRRETEILRYLALGHTNRQIAELLNLSIRTVETHRAHIMDKLDLHNRVELVRFAQDNKIIKNL